MSPAQEMLFDRDLAKQVIALDPPDLVVQLQHGLVAFVDVRLAVGLEELVVTLFVRHDIVGAFHLDHQQQIEIVGRTEQLAVSSLIVEFVLVGDGVCHVRVRWLERYLFRSTGSQAA